MTKLKLRIENLEVESFGTLEAGEEGRGTVRAASGMNPRPPTLGCDIVTRLTGACCEYTMAMTCVETGCDECLWTSPA